jgi:hypothetical protein
MAGRLRVLGAPSAGSGCEKRRVAGRESEIGRGGDDAPRADLWSDRDQEPDDLTIAPAQGEGGLVGYGLGIEQRALPGGPTLIGHLGGAVYRSYVGRLHPTVATIALAMNAEDDPTPLLLPAVKALLATHR